MSLKAKLEAVIYAAEEPVTLAQLAVLFTADALEWKSEQESASASESSEKPEAAEAQPNLVEQFVYPEADEDQGLKENTPVSETEAAIAADPAAETVSNSDSEANQSAALSEEASVEAELEARRVARQRDREARAVIQQLID